VKSEASTKTEPISSVGVPHYKSPRDAIHPPLPPQHAIIAFNFLSARKAPKEVVSLYLKPMKRFD
jgi:hypothetical protein